MIAMLDTSHDLAVCARELAAPTEQLLTPLTRYRLQREDQPFAIDNGAFSGFDERAYRALLLREQPRRDRCRWVTLPDVVGSARRTLECWEHWQHDPAVAGWPRAFVAQDGQESLPMPWGQCACVFIGGSTAWKMSEHAAAIIKAGKILGKWVHVGRVNTPGRWEHFEALGADSIDGTGLSRYSWMRRAIYEREQSPDLFAEVAA